MYNIIIVDDEPKHRHGLAKKIKEIRPLYRVFESINGKDALDFINENPVDIIITDIMMPIMDGLQLIEKLGERIKLIKVIILSGYANFEFAQKAISLGAFDYLLKPVFENKIIEMIGKVEKQIAIENKEKQEKASLQKQVNNTFPIYIEHLLNGWIEGNLYENELYEISMIFSIKGVGTVIVTEISSHNSQLHYSKIELDEIKNNMKYWIKEVMGPLIHSISFFLENNKNIMVTIITALSMKDLSFEIISEKSQNFINNLKQWYGFEVSMGIGQIHENIFQNASEAYKQAQTALKEKFYMGTGKVLDFDSIKIYQEKPLIYTIKEETILEESIRRLDKSNLINTIQNIFEQIANEMHPDSETFMNINIQMVLNLLIKLQNMVSEQDYISLNTLMKNNLFKCETYIELKQKTIELLEEIIDRIDNYKYKKMNIMMEQCLKHIDEYYMQDITLQSEAEKFYFNQNYFSGVFKSYTGVNFSKYLIMIRLQKSKLLLKETELKVYEIALKVGYKDAKYFNRAFKKEFGVSPDDYRRQTRIN